MLELGAASPTASSSSSSCRQAVEGEKHDYNQIMEISTTKDGGLDNGHEDERSSKKLGTDLDVNGWISTFSLRR
jgi:hypothetical protein